MLVVCEGCDGEGEGREGAYPSVTDLRARVFSSLCACIPPDGADMVERDNRPMPWSSERAPYSGTPRSLPLLPLTLSMKFSRTWHARL